MQERNCPNCGAVLRPEKSKCPYCGTSYFDLSAVNISEGEPFYLKLKTYDSLQRRSCIITALVRAEPNITITTEMNTLYAVAGNTVIPFRCNPDVKFEMSFHSVQRQYIDDKHSVTVEYVPE